MFDRILVPLDGSSLAEAIVPYVSTLSSRLNAHVVLVSVIDSESMELVARTRQFQREDQAFRQFLESAEGRAMMYLSEMKRERLPRAEYGIVTGNPAESIIEEQKRRGCDLIAMCTHGRTGLSRSLFGSVTDKVLHLSDVPLLIVRPEESETNRQEHQRLQSLVVPLDGSELSEGILPYAQELAHRLSLEVTLVEAVNIRMGDAFFGGGYYVDPTPLEEELVENSEAYLAEVGQRLRSAGLTVNCKTVLETPAQAVVALAHQTPGSMIAMSTRGSSGVTRWLLGSVTEKVVREAEVPVLVAPPG